MLNVIFGRMTLGAVKHVYNVMESVEAVKGEEIIAYLAIGIVAMGICMGMTV